MERLGQERFPGMTITYALIQMLEKAGGIAVSKIRHPKMPCLSSFCTYWGLNHVKPSILPNLNDHFGGIRHPDRLACMEFFPVGG